MATVRLTADKLAELKQAFMLFDYNKTGAIANEDIGSLIRSVGLKPTQAEVDDIMASAGGPGTVSDLQTLVAEISRRVTNPPDDRPEDMREMFKMYDTEGRGYISTQEMQHLLTTVGEKLTDYEAEQLLQMSGCIVGNKINYEKFIQVMLRG